MQFIYKGIIILLVLTFWFYPGYLFLKMILKSQIDPKATCSRIVTFLSPPSEIIATRDPMKIYQNGKEVGNITGEVETKGGVIIFRQICNTSELNQKLPFEYKKETIKIIRCDASFDIKGGSPVKTNVLEGVVCEKSQ